ncbi:hypothetical protein RN001_005608 [Aquatica leii]|uniref:Uncharacterized protein n=1 Tax=Aquatica leii TaxID=1421715 RepID=A0AAN7Q0J8_9COLE|nr:hypothetical protein RN001_005608 [Aquatica leii]
MYALVVFVEDNEHYVCSTKNISGRFESNQVVPVKWLDNRRYPARVICTHESSAFLEKLDNEKFTTDLFSYGKPSITGDICDNVTAVTVSSFDTADGDYGSDNSIQDPNYIPAEKTNSLSSIVSEDHQQSVNHEEPEYENETEEANTRGFVDVSFTLLPQTERVLDYENLPTFEIPKATGRYTRRYFCIYCKKSFAKLPKHLEHCHANEVAVESFIKLPAGSKNRKVIIEKIRRRGDYEHNTNKEYNTGTLLVARRTKVENHQRNVKIVTCPECKGQFYNYCFYKHFKMCSKSNCKGDKDDESTDNSVDDLNEECVPVASTSTSTVKMKSKRRHVSGHRRFCGSKKSWSIEECSEVKKLFSDCLKTDKLPYNSNNVFESKMLSSHINKDIGKDTSLLIGKDKKDNNRDIKIEGRRIFEIHFLIQQLKKFGAHESSYGCNVTNMAFLKELRMVLVIN